MTTEETMGLCPHCNRETRFVTTSQMSFLPTMDGPNLISFGNLVLVSDLHRIRNTAQECYLCKGIVAQISATDLSNTRVTEMRIWPMGAERQVGS